MIASGAAWSLPASAPPNRPGCARLPARRFRGALVDPFLTDPREVGQVLGVPESPDVGVDAEVPAVLVAAARRDAQMVEPAHGADPPQRRVILFDPEAGGCFRGGYLELLIWAGRIVVEVRLGEPADQTREPLAIVRAPLALPDARQGEADLVAVDWAEAVPRRDHERAGELGDHAGGVDAMVAAQRTGDRSEGRPGAVHAEVIVDRLHYLTLLGGHRDGHGSARPFSRGSGSRVKKQVEVRLQAAQPSGQI